MTRVAIASLGCAKNLVDSEVMLGYLREKGYDITERLEEADVVLVNTCGFIGESQKESIETILQVAHHKSTGMINKLVVTGCLVQIFGDELRKQIPQVDAWVGINDINSIAKVLEEVSSGTKPFLITGKPYIYDHSTPRVLLTPPHYAYLKIAEGCNHLCSFCIIPNIKGALRSRPEDSVFSEAEILINRGVKELILIAQDTTEYGSDLGKKDALPGLIRRIAGIPGDFWIRILYTYPSHWSESLIEVFAEEKKLCKYVDMPIQHISDDILRSMRRGENREVISDIINRIRKFIPQAFIRTSVIAGYPGETDEQFDELMQFLRNVRFERLGAFTFSREKGSTAYDLPGQVSEEIKEARYNAIMELQQEISAENNSSLIGIKIECIVDGKAEDEDAPARYIGRTYGDAPEVDGVIYLRGDGIRQGGIVIADVTGSREYDLVGDVIDGMRGRD